MHGGEIGKFNSEYEEQFHKNMFELRLPFWIGYHGHKYHGTKFVWSDGSADLYNKLNGESLIQGLSAGLCTLVTKSALWNRAHCNETHIVLCRKPGKPVIFTRSHLLCHGVEHRHFQGRVAMELGFIFTLHRSIFTLQISHFTYNFGMYFSIGPFKVYSAILPGVQNIGTSAQPSHGCHIFY